MDFHVTSFFVFWAKYLFVVRHPPACHPSYVFYMIAVRLALIGARVGTAILFSSACLNTQPVILR
ncbi:MAG TPA: hypothetical protein VEZ52_02975 [Desulfovibrio sp.]|uniref:hypothetical protein n=1 Tax=Desulfovibrio sp. TaxID=885 RepID=UPI002D5FD660|nr:hypothetical protein [Desulfovibrio sp.]HZF60569.1 hypothetical protein [Desulfovibrio sp.]